MKAENESDLNVNSSNWWSGLTGWVNDWFTQNGNDLDFNEIKLNSTIDSRDDVLNDADISAMGYVKDIEQVWNKSGNDIYYSSGNVGIATNLSTYPLEIQATSDNEGLVRLNHPDYPTSKSLILGFDSDGLTNNSIFTFKMKHGPAIKNIISIETTSKFIGINTNNPERQLDVHGDIQFSGNIYGDGSKLTNLNLSETNYWALNESNLYYSSGNVGIGTDSPTVGLDVNGDMIRIRDEKTPYNSTDFCNKGEIAWDENYVYVCIADSSWRRAGFESSW